VPDAAPGVGVRDHAAREALEAAAVLPRLVIHWHRLALAAETGPVERAAARAKLAVFDTTPSASLVRARAACDAMQRPSASAPRRWLPAEVAWALGELETCSVAPPGNEELLTTLLHALMSAVHPHGASRAAAVALRGLAGRLCSALVAVATACPAVLHDALYVAMNLATYAASEPAIADTLAAHAGLRALLVRSAGRTDNHEICVAVIGCVSNLLLGEGREARVVAAVPFFPFVVSVMRAHGGSAQLAIACANVVQNFATGCDPRREVAVAAGATPVLVAALRRHLARADVISHVASAISVLACLPPPGCVHSPRHTAMLDAGVLSALLAAARCYPDMGDVSLALNNLCGSDEGAQIVRGAGFVSRGE